MRDFSSRKRSLRGSSPAHSNTPMSHGSCVRSVTTMRAAPMSNSTVRPMLLRWPV
jgi:hypothetical protein